MAMYRCSYCEELKDDDWNPVQEGELCPDCAFYAEEMAAERLREEAEVHADMRRDQIKDDKQTGDL